MDDLVGRILLVSLGEIKAGRGRPVKAFEDTGKEDVFQDSHLLVLLPLVPTNPTTSLQFAG